MDVDRDHHNLTTLHPFALPRANGHHESTSRPLKGAIRMPTEWVRVKDPDTGHEFSMSAEQADLVGAKPISKDAVTAFGEPLPPKYKTTVDQAAAAANKGA